MARDRANTHGVPDVTTTALNILLWLLLDLPDHALSITDKFSLVRVSSVWCNHGMLQLRSATFWQRQVQLCPLVQLSPLAAQLCTDGFTLQKCVVLALASELSNLLAVLPHLIGDNSVTVAGSSALRLLLIQCGISVHWSNNDIDLFFHRSRSTSTQGLRTTVKGLMVAAADLVNRKFRKVVVTTEVRGGWYSLPMQDTRDRILLDNPTLMYRLYCAANKCLPSIPFEMLRDAIPYLSNVHRRAADDRSPAPQMTYVSYITFDIHLQPVDGWWTMNLEVFRFNQILVEVNSSEPYFADPRQTLFPSTIEAGFDINVCRVALRMSINHTVDYLVSNDDLVAIMARRFRLTPFAFTNMRLRMLNAQCRRLAKYLTRGFRLSSTTSRSYGSQILATVGEHVDAMNREFQEHKYEVNELGFRSAQQLLLVDT